MAEHTHEHANDGSAHVHIHPVKFYAGILGALMFLTVVTVAASYVDIDGFLAKGAEVEGVGAWNLIVAILIATMKASLVVLFFLRPLRLSTNQTAAGLVAVAAVAKDARAADAAAVADAAVKH